MKCMAFGRFESKGRYDEIDPECKSCKSCRCNFFQQQTWNSERSSYICLVASYQQGNQLTLSDLDKEKVRGAIRQYGGVSRGCPKGFDQY